MTNSSLLPLLFLLLLAASPLAAAEPPWPPFTQCVGDGKYAVNSTYEDNLRDLVAELQAAVSASHSYYAYRAVGFGPNRVQAFSRCRRTDDACHGIDDNGSASGYSIWAACIADAFRELESACPHHREAYFSNRNCTLRLSEVHLVGTDGAGNKLKQIMAWGLIFQAIGFAWLFFMLLQEWRSGKRGTAIQGNTNAGSIFPVLPKLN